MIKRTILRFILLIVIAALIGAVVYAWQAFPIISGYGAKDICSCAFLSGRSKEDIEKNELGIFPFNLARYSVDMKDSSVTGTVLGLAKKKAIYRRGLGCTLLNGISETELRAQHMNLAPTLPVSDSLAWPAGDQLPASIDSSVNMHEVKAAIAYAFDEPGPALKRNTRAVLVVYKGQLIAERYAPGFNAHTPLTGWSMTKSIMNALIGILVGQKKLDVSASPGFDEWKNDDRKNITLDELLKANSGLSWNEVYTRPSNVTNMLHKEKDMGRYAISQPLRFSPGTTFVYSSGTANILSYIIRKTVGDANYYRFPYDELFHKIGMNSVVLEPDAGGTFVGSSYSFASARDWARFGLLFMNDGIWNGQRILPEGWVKYSTTPAKGALRGEYGAQFWLNAGAPGNPSNRTYPDVPVDCFYADGFEGQNISIIPSKNLVVVRLSMQHGNKLDENHFLSLLMKALPESRDK